MTKFLNTTDNLSIEDYENWETVDMTFDLDWLDLTLSQCFERMSDMFHPVQSDKPVMYLVHFGGNEEELDWIVEDLVGMGIEKIIPNTEQKFKELRPQPRFEIAENLATNMFYQKRLINYKSLTKIFTIRIVVGDELAYDLIKEN